MTGLTIILATHNRAAILEETLEGFVRLCCDGLDPEFVVVLNACSDDSAEVAAGFRDRIPLTVIEEPRPGKNRALNRALDEVRLREIVVFTDDDITPDAVWLHEIVAACRRHPECDVFGGRIDLRWPERRQPEWAGSEWVRSAGFSEHHLGDGDAPYPPGKYPFGPNLWVRSSVFEAGRRYRESIGPMGKGRIMGSETSFLMDLERDGFRMLHCPGPKVEHRIKPCDLEWATLRRRAVSQGRGAAHLGGINHHGLLDRNRPLWYLREVAKAARYAGSLLLASIDRDPSSRTRRMLQQWVHLGRFREALRLAPEHRSERESASEARPAVRMP